MIEVLNKYGIKKSDFIKNDYIELKKETEKKGLLYLNHFMKN